MSLESFSQKGSFSAVPDGLNDWELLGQQIEQNVRVEKGLNDGHWLLADQN